MRLHSLSPALLLLPCTLLATTIAPTTSSTAAPSLHGVVADATGAIVPNAEVDLLDTTGAVAVTIHSDGEGNFQLAAPHAGNYTLVVSEPGFETVRTPIVVAPAALKSGGATASTVLPALAPVHIVLPIAAVASTVRVNGDSSEDLTAPDANHDSSVMTSGDLKALPIFDNDYATAMGAFLDQNAEVA